MEKELALKFRSLFENQRKSLMQSQAVISEDLCVQKDDLIDETDMTSTEMDRSMRMRLRSRENLFLKKIEEALDRISLGRFGECVKCSEDIDMRRLEARPTATHCVSCKEESERMESMHIDGQLHKSLGRLRLA